MFVVKEVQLTAPSISVSLPAKSKVLGHINKTGEDPVVLLQLPEGGEKPNSDALRVLNLFTFPSGSVVKLSDSCNYIGSFTIPYPHKEADESADKDATMAIHIYAEWESTIIT